MLLARPLGLITLVDSRIFVPIIIAVAMVGSYAVDRSIENPVLTLAFGILGYVMIRYDYPRLTIVIALVLGATAERNFHQAMMMGDGSWSIFTSRWMCLDADRGDRAVSRPAAAARALLRTRRGGRAASAQPGKGKPAHDPEKLQTFRARSCATSKDLIMRVFGTPLSTIFRRSPQPRRPPSISARPMAIRPRPAPRRC